jgi:hypothetical protein
VGPGLFHLPSIGQFRAPLLAAAMIDMQIDGNAVEETHRRARILAHAFDKAQKGFRQQIIGIFRRAAPGHQVTPQAMGLLTVKGDKGVLVPGGTVTLYQLAG